MSFLGSLFGSLSGAAGSAGNGIQSLANPALSGAGGGGFMDFIGSIKPEQWMKMAQMFADPNDPKSQIYGALGGVLDAADGLNFGMGKDVAKKAPQGPQQKANPAQLPADQGLTKLNAAAAQGLNSTNVARAAAAGPPGLGPQDMMRTITQVPSMAGYASGPGAQGVGQPYMSRQQPAFNQPLPYLGAPSINGYLIRKRNGY